MSIVQRQLNRSVVLAERRDLAACKRIPEKDASHGFFSRFRHLPVVDEAMTRGALAAFRERSIRIVYRHSSRCDDFVGRHRPHAKRSASCVRGVPVATVLGCRERRSRIGCLARVRTDRSERVTSELLTILRKLMLSDLSKEQFVGGGNQVLAFTELDHVDRLYRYGRGFSMGFGGHSRGTFFLTWLSITIYLLAQRHPQLRTIWPGVCLSFPRRWTRMTRKEGRTARTPRPQISLCCGRVRPTTTR